MFAVVIVSYLFNLYEFERLIRFGESSKAGCCRFGSLSSRFVCFLFYILPGSALARRTMISLLLSFAAFQILVRRVDSALESERHF